MIRRTRVKVCGCTSVADVEAVVEAGADAVGLILAPGERQLTLEQAEQLAGMVPPLVSVVAVWVDPTVAQLEESVKALPRLTWQFSGSEPAALCDTAGASYTKVFHISETSASTGLLEAIGRYPRALPMFDTASDRAGGSGKTFAWPSVREITHSQKVVIAGGLNPGNVRECVTLLRPYAVDVRSGVETGGRKDPTKLRAFIDEVRRADEQA